MSQATQMVLIRDLWGCRRSSYSVITKERVQRAAVRSTDPAFCLCTGCVALGKSSNLAELPFPHLFNRGADSRCLPSYVDILWDIVWEALSIVLGSYYQQNTWSWGLQELTVICTHWGSYGSGFTVLLMELKLQSPSKAQFYSLYL